MSYNAPAVNYPPPPKQGRSPWVWVGVGCGSLVVLFIAVTAIFTTLMVNRMKDSIKKPFDQKAAVQAMNGFPVYPGATILPSMTKAQQTAMDMFGSTMGAERIHVLAYAVPGPSDQVMTWYDNHAEDAGYKLVTATDATLEKFSQGTQQNQYQKGQDRYLVQVQKNSKVKGDLILTTMRLVNYHGRN